MNKLPIPPEALSQHVIVLGKTRSGKSSKVRVLVEWLLAHKKRVVILSPKDDWWGLKASSDGKREGYPIVIFGGKHEDLPFNPRAGAQVAELIATGNRPCLITFARRTPSERTQFYNDFMAGLFKFHQGELYVVIDEVHNFAPKGKVFSPDAGMMIHWSNTLASEGQGQGLIMIAASQRPQKVHNDLLTSCETLIACRVIHKADRDAIKDWIDGCADPEVGRQVLADLASMDRSDAWCWSPEIGFGPKRIAWPMFETFDSFKPSGAAAPAKLKGWADVNLDEVKSKLQAVVKEAEANDPAALKKQIAELQRQIKATHLAAAEPDVREINVAHNRGFEEGRAAGYHEGRSSVIENLEVYYASLDRWAKEMPPRPVFKSGAKPPAAPAPTPRGDSRITPAKPINGATLGKSPAPIKRSAPSSRKQDDRLSRPQQLILDKLSVLAGRDIYPASRATLAAFCRVSPSSSGYEKNLSTLKTLGLIEYPRQGEVGFTPEGEATAAPPSDDGTPREEFWLSIVNEPKARILRALIEEHPKAMSRGAIAQAAEVSQRSSGFEKNLSQLKTLGAIEYPMPGVISLTRYVMP